MTSKRLTKRAMQDRSMERYVSHFTKEVLKRISAATCADHVAFTETLQRHKEDFSLLLQHMADCYKALFANKSSCARASVAITHLANEFKGIRALRKNINTVAMLTDKAPLHHFSKGMYHSRIGSCALFLFMYSWRYVSNGGQNKASCL